VRRGAGAQLARARAAVLVGLAAFGGALFVASSCGDAPACSADDDCTGASACIGRVCVSRLASTPYTVGIELEPPAESGLARRDHVGITFTGEPAVLEIDRQVPLLITLVPGLPGPADAASAVRASLTGASPIAGRPELEFQADGINGGPMQPWVTRIAAPESWIARAARLRVLPAPPLDRIFGPWELALAIAPEPVVILPGPNEHLMVEGVVAATTAPGAPVPTYEARLYVGDRLVSNLGRSDAGGHFVLRAQKTLIDPNAEARIEIAATDPAAAQAVLVLPFKGETNVGVLSFPPAPQALPFQVPVVTEDATKSPVPGATVRFVTTLPAGAGEVRYTAIAQTGKDGKAALALLPGTGGTTRDYAVTVVPPARGEAGSLCVTTYAIAAPATAVGIGAALLLPRRAALTGRVRRFDNHPALAMRLRAVRLAPATASPCVAGSGAVFETTTDGDGLYRLALDPGTYRVELDAGPASGLPRHIVPTAQVTGETALDIALPEPVFVEGRVVHSAAGVAAARTQIRAVAARPDGVEVIGTAITNGAGEFRLVLPRVP
jgi:hypothetical protein